MTRRPVDRTTVRTYMGCNIYPIRTTIMGCRWESYAGGRFLQADTLDGIRELIRHYARGTR